MTQVTIERELLERAIKALDLGYALLESSKSCHAQTLLSAYKELAGATLQVKPAPEKSEEELAGTLSVWFHKNYLRISNFEETGCLPAGEYTLYRRIK